MKIAISREPKLLPVLHGAVRWQALEHGFSDADSDALALAVGEAAGKLIHSMYSDPSGMRLSLEMASHPDRLEFLLEDSGPKARAGGARAQASGETRPSGSAPPPETVFDASYDEPGSQGGNRLRLVKFLPQRAAGKE